MPELPEVETVRRELEPWLTGRTIVRAERVDAPPGPKYAGLERAAGQRIRAVQRRGKFLILPLERVQGAPVARADAATDDAADGGARPGVEGRAHGTTRLDDLVIHLGMTGVVRPDPPDDHLRVRLELDEGPDRELFFEDTRRFGRFLVVPAGDYGALPTLAAMGPEPLSETFTAEALGAALKRSKTAVKTYLLSQKPVAGVGNIYADEALWRARVHPKTQARRVAKKRVGPLRDAIREVLAASIEAQGTTLNDYRTVNGEVGAYLEELAVYGHAEEPCPRCGAPIRKITLGGRGTHFCASCQRRR